MTAIDFEACCIAYFCDPAALPAPDVPELGVKSGTDDIRRFMYWNVLNASRNAELGQETSFSTHFDWYIPSNERRFSKAEAEANVAHNTMAVRFFHSEDATHLGRFAHG